MPPKPTTLGAVPLGHYARLGDGSWVRVVANLQGQPFIRPAAGEPLCVVGEGERSGPRPMPGHTPIYDTRAPAAVARDTAPVADPLGGSAGGEAGPNLFTTEGTP
jgi:hypothetical protein